MLITQIAKAVKLRNFILRLNFNIERIKALFDNLFYLTI